MAGKRILIIEDDVSLSEVLSYNLQQAGYQVEVAGSGQQGLVLAEATTPDIVLLDLMLPEMDGLEVCRKLRIAENTRDTLIVMLTAKSEETDQIVGFAVGADDYVTKPFSVKVLMERIKALLRRRNPENTDRDIAISQGVMLDRVRYVATAGDNRLDLTPTEFSILNTLIRKPGRVFSRSELIDNSLGDDAIVLERTIDVHMRALRLKLGEYAELIETVRGIGYRFRDPRSFEQ